MDWDKLRVFHAVASAGSFTHAGQVLELSQSAVSRQISALEEELDARLFQRHARGLTLTDEGAKLFETASDVLSRLAQAEDAIKSMHEAPRGTLKVTASHGVGSFWLMPRLGEFLKEFPEMEIQLLLGERELDLAHREADLALRLRAPVQADLIQRKLFTMNYHIYASEDYIATYGAPRSIEELAKHTIVAYGEAPPEVRELNWLLEITQHLGRPKNRTHSLCVNTLNGRVLAVEAGLGVSALPDFVAALRPKLKRVLPELQGPHFDVHLVYTEALKQVKRVAVFRDFLIRSAKEWRY